MRCGARDGAVPARSKRDPPYGAQVKFTGDGGHRRLERAAVRALARGVDRVGVAGECSAGKRLASASGGTIPFMGMLGEQFPQDAVLHHRRLGPQSNAHGPNEFLHIDYTRKLTGCVALVLADHAKACAR